MADWPTRPPEAERRPDDGDGESPEIASGHS